MNNQINKLIDLIKNNPNFVVLTGAGVSTASGIPDFRSNNGIYKKYKNAEYLLSINALLYDTKTFYHFYKQNILLSNVQPNIVHKFLSLLESKNKIGCIITQNIDGLHTLAGNKRVIELHGSIYRNYCVKCREQYDLSYIQDNKSIPKCHCDGLIRPDIVLYGESLQNNILKSCIDSLNNTDLLIVMGTSLLVSTATSIIRFFQGKHLIIINNESTPLDHLAEIVIRDDLVTVCKYLQTNILLQI